MRLFELTRGITAEYLHTGLARKANICSKVLAEARRCVQLGKFGRPLVQLLARAGELLEEMDELLVVFDPEVNGRDFAIAALLHRELEFIQSEVSAQKRGPASESEGAGSR
jgi:hypothetical protein